MKMNNKKTINVYWAPAYSIIDKNTNMMQDWSMLYPDPKNLFKHLSKSKAKDAGNSSFFSCPASQSIFKKTYAFQNVMNCEYFYDFSGTNKKIDSISQESMYLQEVRNPNISDGPLFQTNLNYIFFADKPLDATFTAPFFSNSEYMKSGSPIPGEFDIGQWFRPYNIELQMWNTSGKLKFNAGEDLFYVKFNTDENIKLHRFYMSERLESYMLHCVHSRNIFGPFNPLKDRYLSFKNSRLKDAILKEINNNLVGELDD
jgi:hypothetical protein